MSQNDFNLANQGFPSMRADINSALQALASNSSGAEAPATPYANQLWYETDTNILHIRDEANASWLDLMVIDGTTGSPSFTSGNVGIGTNSPASALDVRDAANDIQLRLGSTAGIGVKPTIRFSSRNTANTTNGFAEIKLDPESTLLTIMAPRATTPSINAIVINSSGVITIADLAGTGSRAVNASATGVLSAASDSRLKQEVTTASLPGLAEVMQLEPRAYQWLDDIEKRGEEAAVEIGFFADEVKDIIPSAAPMGNDGYYGFYDRSVVAALTKAIQEQQTIINSLEARITALEN